MSMGLGLLKKGIDTLGRFEHTGRRRADVAQCRQVGELHRTRRFACHRAVARGLTPRCTRCGRGEGHPAQMHATVQTDRASSMRTFARADGGVIDHATPGTGERGQGLSVRLGTRARKGRTWFITAQTLAQYTLRCAERRSEVYWMRSRPEVY